MDLLGTILNKMDRPPSASEREKKMAKVMKAKQEKEQEREQNKRGQFKTKAEKQIGEFLEDPELKKLKFPPSDKLLRSILHEIAEAAGLLSYSFGTEDCDRYTILFKKEHAPSEEELQALRGGEEYDPTKHEVTTDDSSSSSRQPQASAPVSNYREKYSHLIGGLECGEQTAVKMEPKKVFGYVPSANKRDHRSIEETLNQMRSRKRPKLETSCSNDDYPLQLSEPDVSGN